MTEKNNKRREKEGIYFIVGFGTIDNYQYFSVQIKSKFGNPVLANVTSLVSHS